MKINKMIFIMFVFIAVLFGMELISLGDSQQYIVTVDATIYKGEYNGISDQWNFYRTNQSVKKGTIIAEGKIYKKVNSFVREARKEDKGNIPVESHEMMYCENTSGCVKTEVLRIIPKETNSNRLWHEIMIKYYKDELDSISDSDRQKYISELDKHINLYYMNPATNFKLEDGFSHPDYELMRTIKSKIQVSSGEVETTGEYEKMKKFTAQEIKNYINHHDKIDDLPQEVLDAWQNTIEAEPNMEQKDKEDLLYKIENKTVLDSGHTNDLIYNAPNLDNTNRTSSESLDAIMNDGNIFLEKNNSSINTIDQANLQNFSSIMYNVLFAIGVGVAVLMGAVLGVKFMMASVEGKAQIKEWLIKYAVGCAIVFGAFGVWKIIITILEQIT